MYELFMSDPQNMSFSLSHTPFCGRGLSFFILLKNLL